MGRTFTPLLLAGLTTLAATTAEAALPATATLYKNPQCMCCDGYARHLEEHGIDVSVVSDADMSEIKTRAGVPYGKGACHTVKIGDYWIEGHVPMAALEQFFDDALNTAGIGLAGMPIGTPGMPGAKTEPYNVYTFSEHKATSYMTL
ncbi:MAG: hypothetical protein L0J54_09060 [Halomonas sp.]|nr:DUF411 domain-containing protein [Halomonas sp.]MDN6298157.1 hypothetical protein [Halomonas sp.]MDN6315265.1 hypothetical protein [Halomonas sp.]MDN6336625.1 hypothetical protein [Halomonas sp.]